MTQFHPQMTNTFDALLAERELALCALLAAREANVLADATSHAEVTDFKDAASGESLAVVDAAQAEQAALELEQVLEARRRLQDHVYGRCLDCDDPIPLARLKAMPSTPYCTSCQSARERRDHAASHSH